VEGVFVTQSGACGMLNFEEVQGAGFRV